MDDQRDPVAELKAMQSVVEALNPLDGSARRRVLAWAHEACVQTGSASQFPGVVASTIPNDPIARQPQSSETLGDFFARLDPQTESDKALVVGYWMQTKEGRPEFDAQSVNNELKHMGHRIGNITVAFNHLIAQRPQQVIQTKKSGNSKQARKLYKLTTAGVNRIERGLQVDQE
jgi:hypothetical protein